MSSAGMTFVQLYPTDWWGGCASLSLEEEGLYMRACTWMWSTGQPIPGNNAVASKLLRVQIQKYEKVMGSLIEKGKMIRAQGVIINDRVMREIHTYREEQVARSARAKQGHVNRKSVDGTAFENALSEIKKIRAENEELQRQLASNLRDTPPPTPQATPTATPQATPPPTPNQPPIGTPQGEAQKTQQNQQNLVASAGPRAGVLETRNQKPDKEEPLRPQSTDSLFQVLPDEKDDVEKRFSEWWELYPRSARKVGHGECLALFRQLVTGNRRPGRKKATSTDSLRATADELIAGVRSYAATSPDPQYVPSPITWLNQGRWLDLRKPTVPSAPAPRPLPEVISAMTDDQQTDYLAKFANGTWPTEKLHVRPGQPGCAFRPAALGRAGINSETYDNRGIKRNYGGHHGTN